MNSFNRYDGTMKYRRAGQSGVLLPEISLGLWHNFGSNDDYAKSKEILHTAFDRGITHFDLANNYGPPYGSAEETFGKVMTDSFASYRDELFISTKAGHDMWAGPYGEWGSRKHLISSLNASLKRMRLDYVDVFYSHRYDPHTPLKETLQALVDIVRQGKALYVGVSKYPFEAAQQAYDYLAAHDVPCLLYQGRYNLLTRAPEHEGILQQAHAKGAGFVAFSPLAQGLLTDKYLDGRFTEDSRMAQGKFLRPEQLDIETLRKIRRLNDLALARGQSLSEMSLAWLLNDELVTSVVIGASSVEQLKQNLKALNSPAFTAQELAIINDLV